MSGECCQEFLASLWGAYSYSCFYDPITIFFPSVLVKGLSGSHYTQILISRLSLFHLGKSTSTDLIINKCHLKYFAPQNMIWGSWHLNPELNLMPVLGSLDCRGL